MFDTGERHAVMAVRHQARNNFSEAMGKAVRQALPAVSGWTDTVDFYRNRFVAFSAALEYRPITRDGHGARLLPKPTAPGPPDRDRHGRWRPRAYRP